MLKDNELFLKSGYLNVDRILQEDYPFIFIIGARGVGKTYGILQYIYEFHEKALLLRRTQVQADIISNNAFHPYKKLCENNNWHIRTIPIVKGVVGLCTCNSDDEIIESPFAYIAALSTFSNLRGFDASDVDYIFLDEFIPEVGSKPVPNEFEKYLNCYETVNRNRELSGEPPVKFICAANSNCIDNPYFIGLGIVNKIYAMQRKGKSIYTDEKRGLMVINLAFSPISEAKRETALYRLSAGTGFENMALSNEYGDLDTSRISNRERIVDYRPIFSVGEITIYKHKSLIKYYVTSLRSGSPDTYTTTADDLKRCRNKYAYAIIDAFYDDHIIFENATCQVLFTNYLLK